VYHRPLGHLSDEADYLRYGDALLLPRVTFVEGIRPTCSILLLFGPSTRERPRTRTPRPGSRAAQQHLLVPATHTRQKLPPVSAPASLASLHERLAQLRAAARARWERVRRLGLFLLRSPDPRARKFRLALGAVSAGLVLALAWWFDARPSVRLLNATNHPLVVVVDGEITHASPILDAKGGHREIVGGRRVEIPPTSTETPEGGVVLRLSPGTHVFRVASLTRETPLPVPLASASASASAAASAAASPPPTAADPANEAASEPTPRATLLVAPDRAAALSPYGNYLFVAATDEQCFFVQRTSYGSNKPGGPPEVALDRGSFFWPIPRTIDAVFSPNPPPVPGDRWSTGGERVALRQRRCDQPLHDGAESGAGAGSLP
jgi:hypothetical protein